MVGPGLALWLRLGCSHKYSEWAIVTAVSSQNVPKPKRPRVYDQNVPRSVGQNVPKQNVPVAVPT